MEKGRYKKVSDGLGDAINSFTLFFDHEKKLYQMAFRSGSFFVKLGSAPGGPVEIKASQDAIISEIFGRFKKGAIQQTMKPVLSSLDRYEMTITDFSRMNKYKINIASKKKMNTKKTGNYVKDNL